tara:strand:- start:393 stop:626 length:234 start_codon:yes stop_codon:yes gene_type:complete
MTTSSSEPGKAKAARTGPLVNCPACDKQIPYSTTNPYRPFCSERCKVIDLGAWASDQYRIAGNPKELSSDDPDADLN